MTRQTADDIFADADRRGLRRVLIVTAIPLEMRAVRAHLKSAGDKTLRNEQIVELGIFSTSAGDCLVVVAESRAGNIEANASVTYATVDCGPFDMILFVGVAGSRKKDVPIGSVVASSEAYFPYSGKYQGGEFESRPAVVPADWALVQLATKVEREGEWVTRIRAPLRETLPNEEDYPKPHPPRAVIGPIVSVEAVSADVSSQLEIQISKHCGDAQVVEMEGYGALSAARHVGTPAIIIRGVSDAREGKDLEKDAIYQPVAAAHAAAFAFELIALRMNRSTVATLKGRGDTPAIAPPPVQLSPPTDARQLTGIAVEEDFVTAQRATKSLQMASREVLDWSRSLPDGTEIPRPELDTLLAKVEGSQGTTTALLGDPGSGKSALLAALALNLQERGLPFLAIKADLIDPSVGDEEALRIALGLGQSVTSLLSSISRVRPVVLIIDQLDALATYLDLKTGRLNVLMNIVRRLGGGENVHIVVSSRTFEFEHDTRLRTVRADSLHLDLPAWSAVLEILERNGVRAAGWPIDAQRLMRSPQTLKTFLSLLKGGGGDDFTNYQKLLDRLWRERILSAPNAGQLAALTSQIAEDMAERENLWVPSAAYATNSDQVSTLIGAGVLTDFGSDGKIGFTHQTLFEHALARSFAGRDGRLSAYVLSRQASLFVRPKAWAGLSYLRNVDPSTYESEINTIWQGSDRRHLKFLLVEFLGSQGAPTEAEVLLMRSALGSQLRKRALVAMQGSPGWFTRTKYSAIREAMAKRDEVGIAANILRSAVRFDSAGVVELIKSAWLHDDEYDPFVWAVLEEFPRWSDAELELATRVIERTDIAGFAFEHLISGIGAEQPDVALKLTLARLNKQLAEAEAVSAAPATAAEPDATDESGLRYHLLHRSPSEAFRELLEQSDGYNTLDEIARTRPNEFLAVLWPWLTKVLEELRGIEGDRDYLLYAVPYGVDLRFEEEESARLGDHALLAAFATAVVALAANQPEVAQSWVLEHQHEDFMAAHRLFAHTIAVNADKLAEFALAYLTGDVRRLYLGDIHDLSGTTKRLVKAASVHWSDDQVKQFSEYLASNSTIAKEIRNPGRRRKLLQSFERTKLELLQLLPPERLTEEMSNRVAEGVRKFGERRDRQPSVEAQWIGSPMSAEAMSKAKDEDIINAFRRLPDATGWADPRDWMRGGNVQLSREFATFSKSNATRALGIIARLEPEIGTRAAGYALAEMGEVADTGTFERTVLDLERRGFRGEEYRGSIATGLRHLLHRNNGLSDDIVALLTSWLGTSTDHPANASNGNAVEDSLLDAEDEAKQRHSHPDSVLWGQSGFSVLPNGNFPILELMAQIYLQSHRPDELVNLLHGHLSVDDDVRVWSAMLRSIQHIRPDDPRRLEAFVAELFDRYPSLLTTREAAILLAHLQWTMPGFVEGVLVQWKDHSADLVQQARGELAALVSVVQPDLSWSTRMVDDIVSDGPEQALSGVAYAAVNLWVDEALRRRCLEILKRVMPRAGDHGWSAVTDLFRVVDEITPSPEWIEFLEAYAPLIEKHSPVESTFVVDRLQTLLPDEAELIGAIASALVSTWKGELGDIRTATAATAGDLVTIALTLHRLSPATRDLGTSLFEDLVEADAYTARETLDQIDNRFKTSAPIPRRRLPRRMRRAPRLRRPS